MSVRINSLERPLPSDPRVSLLDFLREHLGLHGTKKGISAFTDLARMADAASVDWDRCISIGQLRGQ
jgi:aerobic-type carbon monoxide dehydrogenase small subunit (CoxS/CutS family)